MRYYIGIGYAWDHRAPDVLLNTASADNILWALEHNLPLDKDQLCTAARRGHASIVQSLIKHDCPLSAQACAAAKTLDILKILRAAGCPWDPETCVTSNKDILEWAIENGCPLDARVSAAAAGRGDLEMLRRLVCDLDCPLDEQSTTNAATNGWFVTLKWLMEDMKCLANVDACIGASENEECAILKYFRDRKWTCSS